MGSAVELLLHQVFRSTSGYFVEMVIDDGQPLDARTESAMLLLEGTFCCTPTWFAGDARQYAPVFFVSYNDQLSAVS